MTLTSVQKYYHLELHHIVKCAQTGKRTAREKVNVVFVFHLVSCCSCFQTGDSGIRNFSSQHC